MAESAKTRIELDVPAEVINMQRAHANEAMLRLARLIGRQIAPIVRRFMTSQPQKFEVATGRVLLQGAIIEMDEQNGRATRISRVSEPSPT